MLRAWRRSFAIIATTVLAWAAPACGNLKLPQDNDRTAYRQRHKFTEQWPLPVLLSGKAPTHERPTDILLHSAEAKQQYPVLMSFLYPVEWEQNFEGAPVCTVCRKWWWVSYFASTLYLIGLWKGTSMMKDRQAWDLKATLAVWNLFLAVFSFIGAIRTAPHLFQMLKDFGFSYTVCRSALASYGSGATGLWVALFIFSKYAELFDTVLLVLRKRKVGFLHWYHHCSVLLYCWHAYVWEMPTGIYFVVMNYSVHAIMYFYYFLAAVCPKPPKWALLVTIMQLSQMAFGIAITLSHVYILVYEIVPRCDGHIPNLTAALGMYASYFILFAQFLSNRYLKSCSNGANGDAKRKKLS